MNTQPKISSGSLKNIAENTNTSPVGAATDDANTEPALEEEVRVADAEQPLPELELIDVPSDSKASYQIIDQIVRDSGKIEITTKRIGPSGESYAIRLVQCSPLRFGYIADGENLDKLEREENPNLSVLIDGSIWGDSPN